MLDGETLVFVEVRYRRPGSFAGAVASVDANKQRKLTRTAAFFLGKHPVYRDNPVRFDVVGLEGPEDQEIKLQWLRDAFRPEEN
jgi:putative endonuclease